MIATREQLKNWFRKGLYPLESQFHAWIDSFWHKSEKLPLSQIEGLAEAINGKADASVIDTKQNKTDDSLQTQNKTVTGAINEIKNNLDDATLSSGRLNTIDNEGHINSSLVQGDGISIDESSGIIKADRKWHIDGEIIAIQESLSGHTAKTTAGNTYYYDTEQETLNIIIGKNTKYLYIAANKLVLPVSSINFVMSDEFGIPDKMLRGSMVLEIYYDTTSNLKSVTFKSEGSTDILQYGFDNPYQKEKDLNRVYFEVGSIIYPSLIKVLSVSKMYQKKWLAENGVKLEDNVISGDYKAGNGITIDESTATISAEPKDPLFEQADSVRGNDTDIERSSKSFANPTNDIKILDEAEAMPDHIMVDLTDNSTRFATWDGSKSAWMDNTSLLDSQFFESGSTVDKAMFRGSQLSGSGPISTGFGYSAQFRITTGLPFSVNLRKQIDRVIIASSPFWLSAHSDLQDEAEGISYKNSKNRFAGFFTSRKAIGIPEEAALLVYKNYEDTIRLHDRLHFYNRLQKRYFFNRSWMYSETNVLKEMSLSYDFLMGRSYSELKQRFNGSPDYLYSLTGSVDVDQVSYDAFFGCFPYCMLSAACLENGNIAMYIWKTGDYTDKYIPIPRMRVFFPKNEIIRKIKSLIADGAIDEYGNELTT